jgi:hypothetical protein
VADTSVNVIERPNNDHNAGQHSYIHPFGSGSTLHRRATAATRRVPIISSPSPARESPTSSPGRPRPSAISAPVASQAMASTAGSSILAQGSGPRRRRDDRTLG